MTAFLLEHQHEIDCIDLICPECAEKDRLRVQVQQEIADIYVTSSTPELVESLSSRSTPICPIYAMT